MACNSVNTETESLLQRDRINRVALDGRTWLQAISALVMPPMCQPPSPTVSRNRGERRHRALKRTLGHEYTVFMKNLSVVSIKFVARVVNARNVCFS
jgi:hypothetical protein